MQKMSSDGNEMFREFTKILEKARRRLSECKYIRLVSPEIGTAGVFDYDRSKLLFSTRYASMTGSELAQILLEKYHIQVEMETEHYVLALAAVGDSGEGFERLCQAIEEINQEEAQKKAVEERLAQEAAQAAEEARRQEAALAAIQAQEAEDAQAAGVAASLCVKRNVTPRVLDVKLLQKRLGEWGVEP